MLYYEQKIAVKCEVMKYIIFVIAIGLFSAEILSADDTPYELGHGIQIGQTPIYAGGYLSMEYRNRFSGEKRLSLDDLAFMFYGETDRFDYMMELEANDVYTEVFSGAVDNESVNFHMHLERFYLDYKAEDYTLRAGKFNTFVGFWNRVPINVLRDTTSNPLFAQYLFPRFTSGINLQYHPEQWESIQINLMLQETKDLDAYVNDTAYNNIPVNRHYGIGADVESGQVRYRFNAGTFRETDNTTYYYLTGAFAYEENLFRIQGEIGAQFDKDGATVPYMGYLQGAYRLSEHGEVIVRAESYDDRNRQVSDTFGLIGYTYRPLYPIAIKGEYQHHAKHHEDAVLFSFSIMF